MTLTFQNNDIHTIKSKLSLSKLTYRQYLALSTIFSKYSIHNTHPTCLELKNKMGFNTDRMLEVTLKGLASKGFINYYGNLQYTITEDALEYQSRFIDPLMLIEEHTKVSEIYKKRIKKKDTVLLPIRNNVNLDHPIDTLNNKMNIFHKWYDYVADFPPLLVYSKLKQYDVSHDDLVLDPFCGGGTTLVTSKMLGIDSIGLDINPVLTFVSKTKTHWSVNLNKFRATMSNILSEFTSLQPQLEGIRLQNDLIHSMGFFELHQWLKPKTQNEVFLMKYLIEKIEDGKIQNLFKLALIESAKQASNVSFCPGTSFYPFRKKPTFYDSFNDELQMIYNDLLLSKSIKYKGNAKIITSTCKTLSKTIKPNSIDFLFTSPPYPNDMEYTRQTRLDLHLLDYVHNLNDVKKIKSEMVTGSTKLIFKNSNSSQYVENNALVQHIAQNIQTNLKSKNWGWDYPRMIKEYFGDMFVVLSEIYKVLKSGAYALLVIGDQTSKNIFIPVGKILKQISDDIGFSKSKLELFRVRNSTLHNVPLNENILILRV